MTRTFLTLGPGGLAFEAGPDDVLPWVYTLDTGEDELHVVGGCTGLVEADTRVDLGDGLTLTFDAGTYVEGTVYPSGGHGKRGKRRPGQWGWRARMLRARRLEKARQRRITAAMWAIKPPGGWA